MASRRDRDLGMDRRITRRDFFYGSAAMLGGAILGCGPDARDTASGESAMPGSAAATTDQDYPFDIGPDWYGPGGVGDYASSHGNTPEIIRVAHQVRAGAFDETPTSATDTGETYDLIIVGGGIAGLSAAHHFQRLYPSGRALLLDNHPIFGGEAKRNVLEVGGHRLAAPQGSNDFAVLPETGDPDDYFTSLRIPRSFEYREPEGAGADLRIPLDNYSFLHWQEKQFSVGHHFEGVGWVQDRWGGGLERTPWSGAVQARVADWRNTTPETQASGPVETWLDSMTVKDYYEGVLGLPPEITAYVDPILASIIGLGCDAISAWWGKHFELPGFGFVDRYANLDIHCFPGGNTGLARYFVKSVIPDAIPGSTDLADVLDSPVAFDALDRSDARLRMRLGSMVVRVEHEGARSESGTVRVTYVKDGQAYVTRARGVIMASGGWVNRRVLRDLPTSHVEAYQTFGHSSVLVANVALTNWRFLARAGVAACIWSGGFGFACNIRRPMVVGGRSAPLDPDQPIVMTFYVPLFFPGRTTQEQGILGRTELLTTSFAEYERRIRDQMVRLFSDDGFDSRTDIAAIVLNRWGHAYINPGPGFMYGVNGATAPPDVIRQPFGRIAIGHSELRGHQNWTGAAAEGRRAVEALVEAVL